MNKFYYFRMNVTYQAFLSHYSGVASTVMVMTEQGLKLQLPATRFRSFLTQLGVKGRFRLTVDQNNRFVNLEQVG
ncbi:DUF2835 domain-containing protein [Aliivibrio sp. S3MY1]|uniref:DUF2835 domain-containing protein n=1 Tax=unclassified Aliivibrio TaxID=2645654 RepID=UPI002377D606|nr:MULTISPECIES: DUF2835 domain-containing protein [unclassified Aliivibrio]MDD9194702.1 DUF2835 domain-containing protein [Aliivibrio sp. S3MY1]MDD9198458.1 DUF2835 domain-containing protein [Aliivibrio sp. S2MY1]